MTGLPPVTRWNCSSPPTEAAEALARELGLSRALAGLLADRGLDNVSTAEAFLRPRLALLEDPFRVPNLEAAARLLEETVAAGRGIAILPESTATFYRREDVTVAAITDIGPNQVCLAWDAVRRSPLIAPP